MTIKVLLFARPREVASADSAEVDLAANATYGELKERLAVQFDSIAPLIAVSRLSAAGEFVDDGDTIGEGVEIALIPPVSGG